MWTSIVVVLFLANSWNVGRYWKEEKYERATLTAGLSLLLFVYIMKIFLVQPVVVNVM